MFHWRRKKNLFLKFKKRIMLCLSLQNKMEKKKHFILKNYILFMPQCIPISQQTLLFLLEIQINMKPSHFKKQYSKKSAKKCQKFWCPPLKLGSVNLYRTLTHLLHLLRSYFLRLFPRQFSHPPGKTSSTQPTDWYLPCI